MDKVVQFVPELSHKAKLIRWVVAAAAITAWVAEALLTAETTAKWEEVE